MHKHSVIVGMGEIGKGLYKVLGGRYEVYGIDKEGSGDVTSCSFLNVCVPYSDSFVDIVNAYIGELNPVATIVHSTVPVGTTAKLNGICAHSPVMAKHPNIDNGLKTYTKFIGCDSEDARAKAKCYLGQVMKTCSVEGTKTTELMKMVSLTQYGIGLYVADMIAKLCSTFGTDYETVVGLWENARNAGVEPDLRRPIYKPPNGNIGGHCVIPVMKMLHEQFPVSIIGEVLKRYGGYDAYGKEFIGL